jgi:cobalamin biosynthetic protein CobC
LGDWFLSSNNSAFNTFLPAHGGALNAAADFFNIPREDWLDISTGINPTSWPVPHIPTRIWQRLPEEQLEGEESLEQAALEHYLNLEQLKANTSENYQPNKKISQENIQITAANILPCAGSQQGIRLLPFLYAAHQHGRKYEAKVWVTSGSYAEHGIAWEEQGHRVRKVACDKISELLTQQPVDVLG